MICEYCQTNKGINKISIVISTPPATKDLFLCPTCFQNISEEPELLNEIVQEKILSGEFNINDKKPIIKRSKNVDFLFDLTKKMKDNKEPILFREKEMERIVQILARKTKNNPILIGEPGVGKTAVVELLAQKIANNEIPRLRDHKVLSLNISSLMAGTTYRGQFEQKFEKMIKNIKEKTILFIDEIHLVMGAGSTSGSDIDFANLIKPYLSRGELKLIGATTLDEFRTIEKDEAFNRRLQPVTINALSKENTKTLLKQINPFYEKHHLVKIPNEIISLMVNLSDKYLKNRNFPDKAIDVLDETAAMVSITNGIDIDKSIDKKIDEKEVELLKNDVQRFFKEQHQMDISKELNEFLEENNSPKYTTEITENDVYRVIESMSGVPVTTLQSVSQKEKLRNLEDELKRSVIGQDQAVSVLSRAVKRSMVKIKNKNKPTVLFFAGPTGVGKTESAKALARTLFGTEESLLRFDMSEYMESHQISKLIGSPPGFIGHEEEGQLTEKVRRKPYSVILLDEFEKAHPDVSKLFLQVYDDGRLTDSKGRVIDFSNTIIIMTSNIGATKPKNLGFGSSSVNQNEITLDAIKENYPPEFINRIDEIITFNSLEREDLVKIASNIIEEYKKELDVKGITLELDDQAISLLVDKGYSPTFGARPLERIITNELEDLLVDQLLEDEVPSTIYIHTFDEKLSIQ